MNRGNRSSWHGLWVMPLDHLRWGSTESIRSPRMLANRERPEAVWCRVVDEGLESCQVRLGLSMGVARAVGRAAMLMECFYQNRRIIEEFVLGTLAQVPTSYGHLHTVASPPDQQTVAFLS